MKLQFSTARKGFPWGILDLVTDPTFFNSDYERGLMKFIEDKGWPKNPVFVDVGAHQGIWTTFLAAIAGQNGMVYAVEPHPDNLALLAVNCRIRPGWAPIAVLSCACGDDDAQALLSCYREDRQCATGIAKITASDEPDFLIPTAVRRLDFLSAFLPTVHFIKIDAEHAEIPVLKGAKQLIARDKPRLLVEAHSDNSRAEFEALATSSGWKAERLPLEIDATESHYFVET